MGTSELKPDGWWSRRHQTRAEQDAARERYQLKAKPTARRLRAERRAAHRTTEEQ